ncbi:MAG: hypothetical protein GY906_10115 [bacterium]|nr:hypothetical protein [bacterium]
MGTPIPADQVIFDLGGCLHHSRHRLGCVYCDRNRDKMLQLQRERQQLDNFLETQKRRGKLRYFRDIAEQYAAGLDS